MMLPHFKLISFALCPYVQRARIMLLEKNIPYDIEYIDLRSPPPWFLDISPLEKVPVLLADDKPLFESMPICEYLDEITPGSLHPADPFKKAQNRAWIEYGNDILNLTYQFFNAKDETAFKRLVANLWDRFETLEETLDTCPFFNGEAFGIIDAVYAPIFRFHVAVRQYADFKFFEDTPKVTRWTEALLARPSVKNSVPDTYETDLDTYLKKRDSLLGERIRGQSVT